MIIKGNSVSSMIENPNNIFEDLKGLLKGSEIWINMII